MTAGSTAVEAPLCLLPKPLDRLPRRRLPVGTVVRSHPDRLLWGTDWPHTEMLKESDVPDDADLIDAADAWLGDEATRRKILVETPDALFFGF